MTDSIALITYTEPSQSKEEWNSIREAEFNHQFSESCKGPCLSNLRQTQYILLFFQQPAYLTARSRMHRNFAVIYEVRNTEVGRTSLILCRKNASP